MKSKLNRKIVAVILALEVFVFFFLFSIKDIQDTFLTSLIGAIYLSIWLFFPNYLSEVYILLCAIIAIGSLYYFWHKKDKDYKLFNILVFLFPLLIFIHFWFFLKPINKEKVLLEELELYKDRHLILDSNYSNTKKLLGTKLLRFVEENKFIHKDSIDLSNMYLQFFDGKQNVESIAIDTIHFSPERTFGLGMYSYFYDSSYVVRAFYFSKQNDSNIYIYEHSTKIRTLSQNKEKALIEAKYQLYIDSKYTTNQKGVKVRQATILEKNYWNTTIKEDTMNLYKYRKF
ncbi:MAG: hypothetical protein NTW25_05175 [Candidatus Kapabacteria bacterium]|nr:hypothetical protein [Candidatus Kapabacteria bacterium]